MVKLEILLPVDALILRQLNYKDLSYKLFIFTLYFSIKFTNSDNNI